MRPQCLRCVLVFVTRDYICSHTHVHQPSPNHIIINATIRAARQSCSRSRFHSRSTQLCLPTHRAQAPPYHSPVFCCGRQSSASDPHRSDSNPQYEYPVGVHFQDGGCGGSGNCVARGNPWGHRWHMRESDSETFDFCRLAIRVHSVLVAIILSPAERVSEGESVKSSKCVIWKLVLVCVA